MHRFQESCDYAAFESLFERHKDGLVRFTWRIIGDRSSSNSWSRRL